MMANFLNKASSVEKKREIFLEFGYKKLSPALHILMAVKILDKYLIWHLALEQ
jgi:hypothetical protein